MTFFSQLTHYLLSGLSMGSIYALIAAGFVIIHASTGILNFAQGEFVMLGALLAASFYGQGLSLPLAGLLAVGLTAVIALLMERLTIRPLLRYNVLTTLIVTIGLSVMIRSGALLIWGAYAKPLPPFFKGAIQVGTAVIEIQSLLIMAAAAVFLLLTMLFLNRTVAGKAFRACCANQKGARIVGIRPAWVSQVAFLVASLLGSLGGVLIAPVTTASHDMGLLLGLKGFVAAAMGGLSSPLGAAAGGLILGLAEALAAGLISSAYKDAVAFILLILVLLDLPRKLTVLLTVKRKGYDHEAEAPQT